MNANPIKDLFPSAQLLLGRTPADPDLQSFLEALGKFPIPDFGPEELTIYLEDKNLGYCLAFDDSSTVKHSIVTEKEAQIPIFVGCFLYAEGVDGYHAYPGTLPHGIVWSDNATYLLSKIGAPKYEIMNKKTGRLSSHRWLVEPWMLTARYANGGNSIKHLHLGIF